MQLRKDLRVVPDMHGGRVRQVSSELLQAKVLLRPAIRRKDCQGRGMLLLFQVPVQPVLQLHRLNLSFTQELRWSLFKEDLLHMLPQLY